jgi:predicted transcriptional regulator of viral defense system
MPGKRFKELAEIAFEQHGYLTPADARALGIKDDYLRTLHHRGVLEHPARGVFRLPLVPQGPLDEYMEAALWPEDVVGVLGHETALDLYELSDINPGKIHITVPADHRIQREIPGKYEIHREDLGPDEGTTWRGLPIVTVRRAIEDCIRDGIRAGLIEQAIETARAQGLLRRADVEDLGQLRAGHRVDR